MERAEKIATKDVLVHYSVLGTVVITLVAFVMFFSQGWGFGVYLVAIPSCLGFFALYFKIAELLKPNTAIKGVPLYQHPFGDESYIHGIFFSGYIISLFLLITLGYEALISPHYFVPIFRSFMFLISLTFISCVHLAINKAWITARIELIVKQDSANPEFLDDDDLALISTVPNVKKYSIWSPVQDKFERFTLLNILIYVFLVLMNVLDLISQTRLDILPISLPGTPEAGESAFFLSLAHLMSFIFDPIFFSLVMKTLYGEIYNYKIEKLAPVLVKLEKDDAARERLIKFLEKIQDLRKIGP
nr:hypothetical protein [Candidatus Sigynarchaeota archaeon]